MGTPEMLADDGADLKKEVLDGANVLEQLLQTLLVADL